MTENAIELFATWNEFSLMNFETSLAIAVLFMSYVVSTKYIYC